MTIYIIFKRDNTKILLLNLTAKIFYKTFKIHIVRIIPRIFNFIVLYIKYTHMVYIVQPTTINKRL